MTVNPSPREILLTTIAEMLAEARARHLDGDLCVAEQLYEKVVLEDSANVEAHYLLGVTRAQNGNLAAAEACFRRVIELAPTLADGHKTLGGVLANQGKLAESAVSMRRALALDPNDAEIHHNLGTVLLQQEQWDQAAISFRSALELNRNYLEALYNLAKLLDRQGHFADAIACYGRILELNPNDANTQNNLGILFAKQGNLSDAAVCFRRLLELNPDDANAHNNLGAVCERQGHLDGAANCYRRAIGLNPELVDAHNNLAAILQAQGALDEAAACCERALQLSPENARVHNNLGTVFEKLDELTKAEACFRRAIELDPACAQAYNSLGAVLANQGQLSEAVNHFGAALSLQPDDAEAHYNQAVTLLRMGRLVEGWPEYEWRWKTTRMSEAPNPQPRWTGLPLASGVILLHNEQGLGDTLQFVRYAEFVKQRIGTVVLECQPQLTRLLASCPGVDFVIARGDSRPRFDVHLPLASLPGIFETSRETIPARVPYLRSTDQIVEQWKAEFNQTGCFKIGIAWQGSPGYREDRFRSIPLAQFAGLASIPGVRLYSLQAGIGREQLAAFAEEWPIIDLGDRLGDFQDTAAIVQNLDLVVTCDSSPAHLAGALGVPVWVALSFASDWRWMVDRTETPWYPTMRLFRQQARGDWKGVFLEIEQELRRLV